ncbi:MAG: 2-succinyl-5-enolpyruvyl-6-hydroxy-3-cyclohexene-1-carboxylic-acid synthase [Sphingobacteriia bacterium]|nr:2-succinyl-5-enolpyruvyl-6-hydroxy-3-cyclohexene-1-carboxylic-acid synthase [Sphingobacteriia bacterium]NCC40931.1 2-succinyl-5-enolpyruvyl-6-hydroxy-3-cyclohexene-1-carboxylic-acid synthase [Gammaproteobacteria bacterium]
MLDETTDQGSRNLLWSLEFFDGLVEGGLRRLVVSPGSRSTPLVMAAQLHPQIEITPVLDERSAAFFALGLAQASGITVALVCTSGSAAAHWFPAVIEASESGIPLVLISADRPPELRGWGANQTIHQGHLFGSYTREFHEPGLADHRPFALKAIRALGLRAALVSQGARPGPVHINLPFREPLLPSGEFLDQQRSVTRPAIQSRQLRSHGHSFKPKGSGAVHLDHWKRAIQLLSTGRGIICCGPMPTLTQSATAIWECARILNAPILADPLSGLRFGPGARHRITRYDSFLRNDQARTILKPDWVIRFGGTPVSKTLQAWLSNIPAVLTGDGERWADPDHDVQAWIPVNPSVFCAAIQEAMLDRDNRSCSSLDWCEFWNHAEKRTKLITDSFLAQESWCEAHVIVELLNQLPPEDGLFCANSLPIRQLDTWSGQAEHLLHIHGHRGASGIDGHNSTLAGLNAGWSNSDHGVTGLIGDLAFLHDLSGLHLLQRVQRPGIVLNNGGGRIFDYLPKHGLMDFERLWRMPQRLDLGSLAATFNLKHRVVDDELGFKQALSDALCVGQRGDAAGIIEIHLDAMSSQRMHLAFWSLITAETIIDTD